MKIRIVCYEDVHQWILGKFALKLQENLLEMGIDASIDKVPDLDADINHHIIYSGYGDIISSNDTLMITHIDDYKKLMRLRKQMKSAQLGICMSRETMNNLIKLNIPKEKLTFINPAHDGVIKPRKIIIGITCNVQHDGRKREVFIDKLSKDIDSNIFSFRIMGYGWQEQVDNLMSRGFEVQYTKRFDYEEYIKLIPSLDYYLYTGQDEGQMGFIDALSAGVKTIVTPQGYHLDALNGISFPFRSYQDLLSVFVKITNKKRMLIKSVEKWNWLEYTKKHVEIWGSLINSKGLDSQNIEDNLGYLRSYTEKENNTFILKKKEVIKLQKEYLRHIFHKIKNMIISKFNRSHAKSVGAIHESQKDKTI